MLKMTDWKGVVVFCVSAIVLGVLVFAGKIPAASLAALGGWLIQSPLGHSMLGVSVSSDTPATATAEISK